MRIVQFVLIIVFLVIISIFYKTTSKEVVYVKSDIDDQEYLVRDLPDNQKAANMLARIKKNIFHLTDHLNSKKDGDYKDYEPYIEQLVDKIQGVVINESSENSKYTSYSVNKGEQLVFCLRSRSNKNHLHELNLLMYVVLHEMAHVGCPEYGHTPLFKRIFAFFTEVAIDINLYTRIPFDEVPLEYCGLTISESII